MASLKPLLASIDQAVTIVDLAGHVLAWNTAAECLYGISRKEIVGRDIASFFSPASLMVRRVLETGMAVESTYHQPRPGIHVLITASPVMNKGQMVGALAVERDVSRMVKLSSDLMSARDRVAVLEKQLTTQTVSTPASDDPFWPVRGRHPALMKAIEIARRVAPTEVVTLIRGESGVGKELFARGIHLASRRAKGPFVPINCGAVPSELFESEFFGYAPGAFTGALPKGQLGKLELAEGGTLFLDEVGDLPMEVQVKLLRFLEDRKFYRVGGVTPISVNIRVLAATNRPLEQMVAEGRFREDLYWRLNVICLDLPPLRERKEDVADLIEVHVHEFSLKHGRTISQVEPQVLRALLEYPWPGNVRELRNTIERLVVLSSDGVIRREQLPSVLYPPVAGRVSPFTRPAQEERPTAEEATGMAIDLQGAVIRAERAEILEALQVTGGNRTAAARLLGISRPTLYYKCKNLNISLS